tara:strand:- start:17141 stop:19411 length:2271 start_codon:yes stop_codon:yes gene_type:complete
MSKYLNALKNKRSKFHGGGHNNLADGTWSPHDPNERAHVDKELEYLESDADFDNDGKVSEAERHKARQALGRTKNTKYDMDRTNAAGTDVRAGKDGITSKENRNLKEGDIALQGTDSSLARQKKDNEFLVNKGYDLNNDGVVSNQEHVAAKEDKALLRTEEQVKKGQKDRKLGYDTKYAPVDIHTEKQADKATVTDAKTGLAADISKDDEAAAPFLTDTDDIQQISTTPTAITSQTVSAETLAPAAALKASQAASSDPVKASKYQAVMAVDLVGQMTPAERNQAAGEFQNSPEVKEYNRLSTELQNSPAYKNAAKKINLLVGAGVDPESSEFKQAIKEMETLQAPLVEKSNKLAIAQQQHIKDFKKNLLGEVPQGTAVSVLDAIDVTKKQTTAQAGSKLANENGVDSELSDAIANDPVGALDKMDGTDIESRANIADLPEEALMSTQLDGLLAGMEEGKTPLWAKPAVDKVNAMMAARGMSASTVGRDALFSAIIESAMPIAQDNAKALQARAAQKLDAAVQFKKQEKDFEQQMKITNLQNQQQAFIQGRELRQQTMLANQAAQNASLQFNASSQQQTDQFMASMKNNINQFNATQDNAMKQFNTAEINKMNAINVGNKLQADQFTANLRQDAEKFYESNVLQREQFNATNAQAVQQSDIAWRRNTNTAATAAFNAANQQNVQNEYNLTALDQAQVWLQIRDNMAYIRQNYENEQQRIAQLYATAIGNEASMGAAKSSVTTANQKASADFIDTLFS